MPTTEALDAAGERRAVIYGLIAESIADRGYPPSQSELAEKTGVSKPCIRIDLDVLQRTGYIERDPGVTRGIRLVSEDERQRRLASATV